MTSPKRRPILTSLLLAIAAPNGFAFAEKPAAGADLNEVYLWLHANPELSLKEVESSALMAAELSALGFDVTTGLGDAYIKQKAMAEQGVIRDQVGGYGVVGVFENGDGPTVMIRADMDALPLVERTGKAYASTKRDETWTGVENGVMHACGHDIHMTSWIGTARQLIAEKDNWSGTLVMIAQPAEEIGLGAAAMLADGLFSRFPTPDYNIALHVDSSRPAGKVAFQSGYTYANVDSVDITVFGAGGHGAYPHLSKDPVVAAASIVTAVQTLVSRTVDPQRPAVVTVGSFQAGAKHNIIPDEAKLLLTVRSYDDETRALLLEGIERIAKGQAASFGLPEPEFFADPDFTPSSYNDPDLTALARSAVAAKIGDDSVQIASPVMGGEDFARYGRTVEDIPSLQFRLGAVDRAFYEQAKDGPLGLPSLHSPIFAPEYELAIETGVTSLSAIAVELYAQDAP